jgi:hypothetical protein
MQHSAAWEDEKMEKSDDNANDGVDGAKPST